MADYTCVLSLLLICAAISSAEPLAKRCDEKQTVEKRSLSNSDLRRLEARLIKFLNTKINQRLALFVKGRDGRDGRDGQHGPRGPPGNVGAPGQRGPPGANGTAGPRGRQGQTGSQGPPGPRGNPGPRSSVGGVTYVRYGKTACPPNATLVYKGVVGSGRYNDKGGGSNYLCLPRTPVYARYNDGWQGAGAIYGTEYQVSQFNPFRRNIHNHEAPCAVCYVPSRGSQLMYPARNDCPSGWTREYWGYLMTAHYNHAKSKDFVCVDNDADSVPNTHLNKDGALLYVVQGVCGELPCASYVHGRELTCAVCTK